MSTVCSNTTGGKNLIVVDDNYQNGIMEKLKKELESMQEILKSTLITLEKVSSSHNQVLEASVNEKIEIFTEEAKGILDEQLNSIAIELDAQAKAYIDEIDIADVDYYN